MNGDTNGHQPPRTMRGRQRSLSDTSDTTVVPATFTKDARSGKHTLNAPVTNNPPVVSFPPPRNSDKVIAAITPPTSDSSTSQDSVRQASQRSSYAKFSHHPPSAASGPQTLSPRALQTLLVSLQLLSLVPAIVGGLYSIYRAILPQTRPLPLKGGLVKTLEWNRRIEWLLCALWAGLSGNYCHSMARGLTRRWLVYYPLPAAIIRLVSTSCLPWRICSFSLP